MLAETPASLDVTRMPRDVLDVTSLPTQLTSPRAADSPIEPGTVLGSRYRIVRLLGRGGMGAVYLADDLRLGQPVALKLLPRSLARDPRRLAQFHNEVSVARQISHPNVCRVYDISDVDGRLFLSMEYVEGEDLAVWLRRGPFSEQEAVELVRGICAGLSAVHARGVLHRDLKPANIMLNRAGQPQLMDFGIASAADAESDREGTPTYMAPEHLLGEAVSVQSDIYALGLVMHEIFTGRRVFDAHTPLDALVTQHRSQAAAPPIDLSVIANPRLRDTILACLDRNPERRPPTAQAVSAMLHVVLLDATTVWRRVVQIALQMLFAVLLVGGLNLLLRGRGAFLALGLSLLAGSALTAFAAIQFPLGWTIAYKGHRIKFRNHPLFGERLFIDDRLVDRGRIGFTVTLHGTIESGVGAGERITAHLTCSFIRVSCRMVAESF